MQRIAVVDYGSGNLRSVAKALEHVAPNADVIVTSDTEAIRSADRIVFPGQGAARDCMQKIRDNGLRAVITEAFVEKPFLGICMGLQVLFERSDENGGVECLKLVAGGVRGFVREVATAATQDALSLRMQMKVPHMGWNQVSHNSAHPLWRGIEDGSRFYFVHSYYVVPEQSDCAASTTDYLVPFTSAIATNNAFAVQFHPEKSAADGLQLLQNFVNWKVA